MHLLIEGSLEPLEVLLGCTCPILHMMTWRPKAFRNSPQAYVAKNKQEQNATCSSEHRGLILGLCGLFWLLCPSGDSASLPPSGGWCTSGLIQG